MKCLCAWLVISATKSSDIHLHVCYLLEPQRATFAPPCYLLEKNTQNDIDPCNLCGIKFATVKLMLSKQEPIIFQVLLYSSKQKTKCKEQYFYENSEIKRLTFYIDLLSGIYPFPEFNAILENCRHIFKHHEIHSSVLWHFLLYVCIRL